MRTGAVVIMLVVRIVALFGIIVPLFASIKDPMTGEWVAIFFTALLGYAGTYLGDYYSFLRGKEAQSTAPASLQPPNRHDVDQFRILQYVLDPQTTFRLFGEHDFSNAFEYQLVDDFHRFYEGWNRADKHFVDEAMEVARKEMYEKASIVANDIAKYTRSSTFHKGWQTVRIGSESEDSQPERIWDEAKTINKSAREFARSYSALIKLGNRKLAVPYLAE